ncbi:hypothetical protein, partial [Paraburkholderia sp. CI2]|uniref:hypothetical protein n=1 Tax=Paraburkholderia sp. CI2 TaxID=2723093 RepID=UPI001C85A78E
VLAGLGLKCRWKRGGLTPVYCCPGSRASGQRLLSMFVKTALSQINSVDDDSFGWLIRRVFSAK